MALSGGISDQRWDILVFGVSGCLHPIVLGGTKYNLDQMQIMQIHAPCPNPKNDNDGDSVGQWKHATKGIDLGLNGRVSVHIPAGV